MDEKTIVKTMKLPGGRDWEWYGDLNVVVLAPHLLSQESRDRALMEVSAHWRRSCLRIVPDLDNFVGPPTEPFTLPRQAAMQPVGQQ